MSCLPPAAWPLVVVRPGGRCPPPWRWRGHQPARGGRCRESSSRCPAQDGAVRRRHRELLADLGVNRLLSRSLELPLVGGGVRAVIWSRSTGKTADEAATATKTMTSRPMCTPVSTRRTTSTAGPAATGRTTRWPGAAGWARSRTPRQPRRAPRTGRSTATMAGRRPPAVRSSAPRTAATSDEVRPSRLASQITKSAQVRPEQQRRHAVGGSAYGKPPGVVHRAPGAEGGHRLRQETAAPPTGSTASTSRRVSASSAVSVVAVTTASWRKRCHRAARRPFPERPDSLPRRPQGPAGA